VNVRSWTVGAECRSTVLHQSGTDDCSVVDFASNPSSRSCG